jgi:hypothetical protein
VRYAVATVVGWYLELFKNLANQLVISSLIIFIVNLACSENIAEVSSGVIEVDGCDTFAVCSSFA